MKTGVFGLGQSNLHDFFGDALNFNVHLERGNTGFRARHFEVHIAKVIFIAKNVGQNSKPSALFNEPHGNTGHMRLKGNAGIHKR